MVRTEWTNYDLGTGGWEYLKEQLSLGKTVAYHLLKRVSDFAHVQARLPRTTSAARAVQFHVGGLLSLAESRRQMVNEFRQYLLSHRAHCALLEDPVGKPSDPYIARTQLRYAIYGDDVYYVLTPEAGKPAEVEHYLRMAYGYPFIAVLTHLDPSSLPPAGGEIDTAVLQMAANNADRIIIAAYDGEGFVVASAAKEGDQRYYPGARPSVNKGLVSFGQTSTSKGTQRPS